MKGTGTIWQDTGRLGTQQGCSGIPGWELRVDVQDAGDADRDAVHPAPGQHPGMQQARRVGLGQLQDLPVAPGDCGCLLAEKGVHPCGCIARIPVTPMPRSCWS